MKPPAVTGRLAACEARSDCRQGQAACRTRARPPAEQGGGRGSRFSTDADVAILRQEPLRARVLLRSIGIVMALFIFWAAVAQLDEVTRGEGKVIPSKQVQVLQSIDGGLVSEILVREGEVVAGQPVADQDRRDALRFFGQGKPRPVPRPGGPGGPPEGDVRRQAVRAATRRDEGSAGSGGSRSFSFTRQSVPR